MRIISMHMLGRCGRANTINVRTYALNRSKRMHIARRIIMEFAAGCLWSIQRKAAEQFVGPLSIISVWHIHLLLLLQEQNHMFLLL